MGRCDKCQQDKVHTIQAIVKDVYYPSICEDCMNDSIQVSSGDARWQRSLDAEDNEASIQQPYQSDGTPNPKFMKLYPKQAKALFTPDEFRNANR